MLLSESKEVREYGKVRVSCYNIVLVIRVIKKICSALKSYFIVSVRALSISQHS